MTERKATANTEAQRIATMDDVDRTAKAWLAITPNFVISTGAKRSGEICGLRVQPRTLYVDCGILGHPGFVVIFWETAELSTSLRSGRDDKRYRPWLKDQAHAKTALLSPPRSFTALPAAAARANANRPSRTSRHSGRYAPTNAGPGSALRRERRHLGLARHLAQREDHRL